MIKNSLKLAKKIIIFNLLAAMIGGFFAIPAQAVDPLVIEKIEISYTDTTATIVWQTNRPAVGKIQYGIYTNDYYWTVDTNIKQDTQAVTISGLYPETTYYFKIVAKDDYSEVESFEKNFKTEKHVDNQSPTISDVRVVYLTGKTATIQWRTDEPAASIIEYGKTTSYGSTKTDNNKVEIHDITITGLNEGTQYHFLVKSKDADNNTSLWYDMIFQTYPTSTSDNDDLIIYDIHPTSQNDTNITETSVVISWRTNKLTEGKVYYGTSLSYGKTITTNPPRNFSQSVTLIGLTSGQTYYFKIETKDVLGKTAKIDGYTFTTKSSAGSSSSNSSSSSSTSSSSYSPQVLGASTCDINLTTDFGFYGLYYNHDQNHPDFEIYKGSEISWSKVADQNDWYDDKYFTFDRIDNSIDFGDAFFPINEGLTGDPFYFAVHWRAIIDVPANGYYPYTLKSDDDSWLFIDGQLASNLNGIHQVKSTTNDIYLTAGYHKLEIYYAERAKSGAYFSFRPNNQLKFHPLPLNCDIQDVIDYNNWLKNPSSDNGNQGTILGESTTDYTPAIALYKATNSPDIWAILVTGQKHYITSPLAFERYGYNWNDVKTVSQKTLGSYPNVTLVRTPDNSTIYYLYQRPEHKWLKTNIPSPTVFVSYPNNYWGNVARVDILDIQAYPDTKLIKATGKPEVYLIEGATKRHIASEEIFKKYGYDWAEVVEISQIHLDGFQDGPAVQ